MGEEDDGDLIAFSADQEDEEERRARAGRGRRGLLLLIGGGSVAVIAAGLAGAFTVLRPLMKPGDYEGKGTVPVVVEILPGSNAGQVADVLVQAEVVASARAFVQAVEDRGKSGGLHPGRYRLRKRMAAVEALNLLLAPQSRIRRRVTVPEGLRAVETVARLAKGSGLPAAELSKILARPAELGLPAYAKGAAEGFLFPATYDIERSTTPRELLRAMVRRFERAAASVGLQEGAARQRLTPGEVVVVASIVQAEGGREADYPKIARVIYNRLASGAKLEMDSTVMYGLGKHGIMASNAEIKRDTPYNTYMRPGLPPGPISNPGEAALIAALRPAKGDWYWFVTVDPQHRITKFTDKESEFVKYREELHKRVGRH
ncbi:endolytic transglycosylase MltG [Sphaerisporangium melleum]|uniref:endolytic transglycosylase MltG n=1 Tax=Sphaerisporangium melleum TaxID=321316 RepID=UPI00166F50B0|nr:endolytic transglycosylase MltG [Sphaerisporangium melleum]